MSKCVLSPNSSIYLGTFLVFCLADFNRNIMIALNENFWALICGLYIDE